MMSKIVRTQMTVCRPSLYLKSIASPKSNSLSSAQLLEYQHNIDSVICRNLCSKTAVKYNASLKYAKMWPSYKINDARLSGILLNNVSKIYFVIPDMKLQPVVYLLSY